LEMMRLAGTVQPLVIASVPQRTYTKATIKMNSAVISVTLTLAGRHCLQNLWRAR
jgi:hypothetical protein